MIRSSIAVLTIALYCICWHTSTAFAQRDLTNIPVPDPAEELKTFVVADGFEVNLFAADPQIHKPIQFNFDPQGRLWVAASEVYPQIAPGQQATDKILILEDTDGDGVADKTTVFADGLLIPTGILPGDGGCYVANSTELLHLSDTDGDGKADRTRIILSGFGTEDTHHIIHTFRWGPESLFYLNQSIYIHSHVETPFGVRRLNAGGIWQFRPETLRLDVFARGWVNTWGHAFDRWGQSFATDGAGGEGINYVVPGAAYPTAFGVSEILHGLNPGSPKYCGLTIVDGPHLPPEWQGNLMTHDFRGHRVCRFIVEDEGSGFVSKQQPDLIRSTHVAFRPIDVQQGPDGAIYIADWYNPIIQHGEVDFRDPRRDHVHGRIWRVTAKGRDLHPRPQLIAADLAQLLDELKSPISYNRQQAKRVLKERDRDEVLEALEIWLANLNPSDADFEHQRLEALWLYQAHDEVNGELLRAVLSSPQPHARAAAVRVLPHWAERLERPEEWLAAAVHDEFPRVRLEAVRALAAIPTVRSAELALAVVDLPRDGFLDYAARQTARELKPVWLPAVLAGTFQFDGKFPRLMFAVEAGQAAELVPTLVKQMQEGKIAESSRGQVLEIVGVLGAPPHLSLVLDRALQTSTASAERADLLRALLEAQRRRNTRPEGDLSRAAVLLQSEDAESIRLAIECLGKWKVTHVLGELTRLATDPAAPLAIRQTAVVAVANIAEKGALATLLPLVKSDPSEALAVTSITALVAIDPGQAAIATVDWLSASKDAALQMTATQAFLNQQGAVAHLASALKDSTLPTDVAKIALRAVTASGRAEPALTEALTKAGGITSQAVELTPAEMAEIVAEIRTRGDAASGEAIFRRHDLTCFKCHAIGGAGGKVGPDLLSIGTSAQMDYLVDSLLAPNKNVKEGFQTVVALTDEGKVFTGIKVRESDEALILRDIDDKEIAVPLKSIDEVLQGTSLMPAGLTDKLTRSELIDLVRFLSELGKPGLYAIDPTQPVARTWRALVPNQDSYRRLTRTSDAQLMASDESLTWKPAYSAVSGDLPVTDLPQFSTNVRLVDSSRQVAFVRTWLDVREAGTVTLQWNDISGLQAWVDGQPLELDANRSLSLTAGRHAISVAIDLKTRTTPLRLSLGDSPAAQWTTP